MHGGGGRGLHSPPGAPPLVLKDQNVPNRSGVPLAVRLQPRLIGMFNLNMANQSGVPFAVRLLLVLHLRFRDLHMLSQSGVPLAVRLLSAQPRVNLSLRRVRRQALSHRGLSEVPQGWDVVGRVPFAVRRLNRSRKAALLFL